MSSVSGSSASNGGRPVSIQNATQPLLTSLGYTATTSYVQGLSLPEWVFSYGGNARPDAIPDLAAAMQLNPSMRVFVASGLHDLATPWYQTELDTARLALPARVTLRNYAGGHMTYFTEASRRSQHAHVTAFLRGEAVPAASPKSLVEAPARAAVLRASTLPLATVAEWNALPLGPWLPEHVRLDPQVVPQTRGDDLQKQVDEIIGNKAR